MSNIMFRVPEELDEIVTLYQQTPEGDSLWTILDKLDRYCSNWMNSFEYLKMKKELFVQIIEFYHGGVD